MALCCRRPSTTIRLWRSLTASCLPPATGDFLHMITLVLSAVVRAPASALLSILLSRTAQAVLAGCRPLLTLLSVSVCRHSSGTSNFNNGGTNVAYNPQWASTKSGGASQNCAFQASHHTEA